MCVIYALSERLLWVGTLTGEDLDRFISDFRSGGMTPAAQRAAPAHCRAADGRDLHSIVRDLAARALLFRDCWSSAPPSIIARFVDGTDLAVRGDVDAADVHAADLIGTACATDCTGPEWDRAEHEVTGGCRAGTMVVWAAHDDR